MFSIAQLGSPLEIHFDDSGRQPQPVMAIVKRPDQLKRIMNNTTEGRDGASKLNLTGASVFLA